MKNLVRKSFYILLYILVIICFIFLGKQDYRSKQYSPKEQFNKDYKELSENKFTYITTKELLEKINNGNSIIFIGDKDNEWSHKYASIISDVFNKYGIKEVFYYDAGKLKQLRNKNYYDVIAALDGYLITTDDSNDNLFTPSLYIIENGKIIYHNSTSSVVNNDDTIDSYWTIERKELFTNDLENVLSNYID